MKLVASKALSVEAVDAVGGLVNRIYGHSGYMVNDSILAGPDVDDLTGTHCTIIL